MKFLVALLAFPALAATANVFSTSYIRQSRDEVEENGSGDDFPCTTEYTGSTEISTPSSHVNTECARPSRKDSGAKLWRAWFRRCLPGLLNEQYEISLVSSTFGYLCMHTPNNCGVAGPNACVWKRALHALIRSQYSAYTDECAHVRVLTKVSFWMHTGLAGGVLEHVFTLVLERIVPMADLQDMRWLVLLMRKALDTEQLNMVDHLLNYARYHSSATDYSVSNDALVLSALRSGHTETLKALETGLLHGITMSGATAYLALTELYNAASTQVSRDTTTIASLSIGRNVEPPCYKTIFQQLTDTNSIRKGENTLLGCCDLDFSKRYTSEISQRIEWFVRAVDRMDEHSLAAAMELAFNAAVGYNDAISYSVQDAGISFFFRNILGRRPQSWQTIASMRQRRLYELLPQTSARCMLVDSVYSLFKVSSNDQIPALRVLNKNIELTVHGVNLSNEHPERIAQHEMSLTTALSRSISSNYDQPNMAPILIPSELIKEHSSDDSIDLHCAQSSKALNDVEQYMCVICGDTVRYPVSPRTIAKLGGMIQRKRQLLNASAYDTIAGININAVNIESASLNKNITSCQTCLLGIHRSASRCIQRFLSRVVRSSEQLAQRLSRRVISDFQLRSAPAVYMRHRTCNAHMHETCAVSLISHSDRRCVICGVDIGDINFQVIYA